MNTMILKTNHPLSAAEVSFEMEQHLLRTLKWTFFFFLPIVSGFRIAFNLLWRVSFRDRYSFKWANQSAPLKIREYEENS